MAGLPGSLSRVLNDKVLTFLNRARKHQLGPLPSGDILAYYGDALSREKRTITSEMLMRATKATKGFPYLLQLIGYYIVELTAEGDEVAPDVLEQAIAAARLELIADVFSPTLNALSPRDIEVLRAIAAQKTSPAAVAEIRAALGMGNSYFQQYRARLIDAGVIEAPRDGALSITVPYLAEYLNNGDLKATETD